MIQGSVRFPYTKIKAINNSSCVSKKIATAIPNSKMTLPK